MDILARIEEVIKQRGTNKAEVSDKMGKAKQNFKSLLTNPKWDSLELVCKAIGIEPWQLFEQEIMAAGYRRTAETQQPAPQPADGQQQQRSAADELPFTGGGDGGKRQEAERTGGGQPTATVQQAIICPHCKRAIAITVNGI